MRRLNDIVGEEWNLDVQDAYLSPTNQTTKGGKSLWLATVRVALQIRTSTRGGVGAALMADPDDAIKTAQAEALKKASNQFGMALELWTEEGREDVARGRAIAAGDLPALKQAAFQLALEKGAEANPASIAATLGIEEDDLQDAGKLAQLLGASS